MFTDYLVGKSPSKITRDLTKAGVRSPRGEAWNRQTVTNLLANRAYIGELHGVRGARPRIIPTGMWNRAQNVTAD